MGFDSGASLTRLTGGPITFYEDYTTTNLYVLRSFGGNVNTIVVQNDTAGSDKVQVSWDGATLEGDIKAGESLTLNSASHTGVYVKATTGGEKARIWGW